MYHIEIMEPSTTRHYIGIHANRLWSPFIYKRCARILLEFYIVILDGLDGAYVALHNLGYLLLSSTILWSVKVSQHFLASSKLASCNWDSNSFIFYG